MSKLDDIISKIKVHKHFYNFNKKDKESRGILPNQPIEFYIKRYIDNLSDFTKEEMNEITNMCKKIDSTGYLVEIKWQFMKLNYDSTIEHGFPHTFDDIIILRSNFFSYDKKIQFLLLIHEKTHLWQKRYPHLMDNILIKEGYEKVENNMYDIGKVIKKYGAKIIPATNMDVLGVWCKDNKIFHTHYVGDIMVENHPYELYAERIASELSDRLI